MQQPSPVEETPPPAGCKLFLRNIPADYPTESLVQLFYAFGVVHCERPSRVPTIAFLTFQSQQHAEWAMQCLDGSTFDTGKQLIIKYSNRGDKSEAQHPLLPQQESTLDRQNQGLQAPPIDPDIEPAQKALPHGEEFVRSCQHVKASAAPPTMPQNSVASSQRVTQPTNPPVTPTGAILNEDEFPPLPSQTQPSLLQNASNAATHNDCHAEVTSRPKQPALAPEQPRVDDEQAYDENFPPLQAVTSSVPLNAKSAGVRQSTAAQPSDTNHHSHRIALKEEAHNVSICSSHQPSVSLVIRYFNGADVKPFLKDLYRYGHFDIVGSWRAEPTVACIRLRFSEVEAAAHVKAHCANCTLGGVSLDAQLHLTEGNSHPVALNVEEAAVMEELIPALRAQATKHNHVSHTVAAAAADVSRAVTTLDDIAAASRLEDLAAQTQQDGLAAYNTHALRSVFVTRKDIREHLGPAETLLLSAPTNSLSSQPLPRTRASVLPGALVRVLINGVYSLRFITGTLVNKDRLYLRLDGIFQPVFAESISNGNPLMEPSAVHGENAEVPAPQPREIQELAARMAFMGTLNVTSRQFGAIAWRLRAAKAFLAVPAVRNMLDSSKTKPCALAKARSLLRQVLNNPSGMNLSTMAIDVEPVNPASFEETNLRDLAAMKAWHHHLTKTRDNKALILGQAIASDKFLDSLGMVEFDEEDIPMEVRVQLDECQPSAVNIHSPVGVSPQPAETPSSSLDGSQERSVTTITRAWGVGLEKSASPPVALGKLWVKEQEPPSLAALLLLNGAGGAW